MSVKISGRAKVQIEVIRKNIKPFEMGGICFGLVNKDKIIITELVGMLKDDISEVNGFVRNSCKEYNKIIAKKWKHSDGLINYVGEWHTHNEDYPTPSNIDNKLLNDIQEYTNRIGYKPIVLIIGLKDNRIMIG